MASRRESKLISHQFSRSGAPLGRIDKRLALLRRIVEPELCSAFTPSCKFALTGAGTALRFPREASRTRCPATFQHHGPDDRVGIVPPRAARKSFGAIRHAA